MITLLTDTSMMMFAVAVLLQCSYFHRCISLLSSSSLLLSVIVIRTMITDCGLFLVTCYSSCSCSNILFEIPQLCPASTACGRSVCANSGCSWRNHPEASTITPPKLHVVSYMQRDNNSSRHLYSWHGMTLSCCHPELYIASCSDGPAGCQ